MVKDRFPEIDLTGESCLACGAPLKWKPAKVLGDWVCSGPAEHVHDVLDDFRGGITGKAGLKYRLRPERL